MDRWRRAYTHIGLEGLDHRRERLLVYGAGAAFWIHLASWLILRDGIIPKVEGPFEWLLLALLAIPGTARAAFLIALGPNRKGEWEMSWVNPNQGRTKTPTPIPAAVSDADRNPESSETPPTRKWWRIRPKIGIKLTRRRRPGRRSGNVRPGATTRARPQGAGEVVPPPPQTVQPHPRPVVPAQNRQRRGGSITSTVVKILVGLALFAVCGGYWVTGGNFVDPSDATTDPPRLRNIAEKRHMLRLINEARATNGAPPVILGRNNVAQIQADQMLHDCVLSHWGTDGLKPYMRYSLSGGYQTNGENALTYNECGLADTLLQWNDEPMEMVSDAVEGWLDSPGHRETMLSPSYTKVNIGLAWDRNTFKAVQHFEGDYVVLPRVPDIQDGELTLKGRLKESYEFDGQYPLMAVIIYDPRPRTLTRAQLAQTSCYSHGEVVAAVIPPSPLFRSDYKYTGVEEGAQCTDPYKTGSQAEMPETRHEMERVWNERRERSERIRETEVSFQVMKALELTVESNEFTVTADLSSVLDEYGPGVYTVAVLAELEGIGQYGHEVISEYSIFHEVTVPGGYDRD